MSVKIYEAWRIPDSRLNDYLDWARPLMLGVVKERIEELMAAVKPEVLELGNPPEHFFGEGLVLRERQKRLDYVIEGCREAAQSGTRDTVFDIECGFNIWIHDGCAYLIPFGEAWILSPIQEPPDWVEEYHYQNSADPPEDVTPEDWARRRENWDEVCLKDHNRRRMSHEVVAAKTSTDTFDLEWALNKRALIDWVDLDLKPDQT